MTKGVPGATLAQGALRITVAIRNARTGGAAGAIDRWLLGNNHIYDSATAKGGAGVESKFVSNIMKPRLVVFHDDEAIQQIFVCAENTELPTNGLIDGFIHLMAAYYVFNVQYPNFCKALLFFFQDILMEMTDKGKHRPIMYSTYIGHFMK